MMKLTERQRDILNELRGFDDAAKRDPDWHPQWATPYYVGGRDGSYHQAVLVQLCCKDLAERKRRSVGIRGSWKYRITSAGRIVALNSRSR